MRNLLYILTSKKFWAAVGASVPLAIVGEWQAFAAVWMAYLGSQGIADHGKRREVAG